MANLRNGRLSLNGGLDLSDRSEKPRFYTLHSNDTFQALLAGDSIRAGGTLIHPGGYRRSRLGRHDRASPLKGHRPCRPHVPGLTFGPNPQADEITRLTQGVFALVNGPSAATAGQLVRKARSPRPGTSRTAGMDLLRRSGRSQGISGDDPSQDLLGLRTPPGQPLERVDQPRHPRRERRDPLPVLPNQLVKIERGEWPFMGGRLILHETVLNFGRPSAKRLTFQVAGSMHMPSFSRSGSRNWTRRASSTASCR